MANVMMKWSNSKVFSDDTEGKNNKRTLKQVRMQMNHWPTTWNWKVVANI